MKLLKYITLVISLSVSVLLYILIFSALFEGSRTAIAYFIGVTIYYVFIFYQLKLGWKENERNCILNAFWTSLFPFLLVLAAIIFLASIGGRLGC